MNKQETYIEYTGNIQVHHPVKQPKSVEVVFSYHDWFNEEWEKILAHIEAENPRRDA